MYAEEVILIEKICHFLQENDYVRLTKLLNAVKEGAKEFYPTIETFKKRSIAQRLGEIASASASPGFPLGVLGAKAEKEEAKQKLYEQKLLLCLELKNTIRKGYLNAREKNFLEIVYRVLYGESVKL